MIHNVAQYKLAHLLISECLFGLQLVISCNNDIDALVVKLTSPEELKMQMDYLEEISWQNRALVETDNYEEIFNVYQQKNKVPEIVPGEIHIKRRVGNLYFL